MKKFLFITSNVPFANSLQQAVSEKWGFDETKCCDHEQALATYLDFQPTHVLISEYEEPDKHVSPKHNAGCQTYADITAAKMSDEIILRCGWFDYKYDDYLRLPFRLDVLKKHLNV